jgi:hypothetical protein
MYIYIHIPKNSGKYIRNSIKNNQKNKIIKGFWGLNIKTYDLSKYFDKELLQIVNEVYKKDFEIFNYEIKTEI